MLGEELMYEICLLPEKCHTVIGKELCNAESLPCLALCSHAICEIQRNTFVHHFVKGIVVHHIEILEAGSSHTAVFNAYPLFIAGNYLFSS